MAACLLELAANIVSSHASKSAMTTEELLLEIKNVHAALHKLDMEAQEENSMPKEEKTPSITLKKAFQADQVFCMICGKGGMKTLASHLAQTHKIKHMEYRKLFNVSKGQPLTAKIFSETRKRMAKEKRLAENLAKAREARGAKIKAEKSAQLQAGITNLTNGQRSLKIEKAAF